MNFEEFKEVVNKNIEDKLKDSWYSKVSIDFYEATSYSHYARVILKHIATFDVIMYSIDDKGELISNNVILGKKNVSDMYSQID